MNNVEFSGCVTDASVTDTPYLCDPLSERTPHRTTIAGEEL